MNASTLAAPGPAATVLDLAGRGARLALRGAGVGLGLARRAVGAARYWAGEGFLAAREAALVPGLVATAAVARVRPKAIDVGMGPDPLINAAGHKRGLVRRGYTVETFVRTVWHTTSDFDVRGDLRAPAPWLVPYWLFAWSALRYRVIYIYFTGGPLAQTKYLWPLEPFLYRLAGSRIVVMPFGADVATLDRMPNLPMRDGYLRDYPDHCRAWEQRRVLRRVAMWSRWAHHVVSGCDWVDYTPRWDTLMLAHFSVDPGRWVPGPARPAGGPLRVLHAPNHRTLKGTSHFLRAVEELRAEGEPIELVLAEKVPNDEIRRLMATVDVVADQLIVGWYAMFALEGMMMEKPVVCYLRPDLLDFYIAAGLLGRDEMPIISATPTTVKETLRRLVRERDALPALGRRSREYAVKHHSVEAIGAKFQAINERLGVPPSGPGEPAPCPRTAAGGAGSACAR